MIGKEQRAGIAVRTCVRAALVAALAGMLAPAQAAVAAPEATYYVGPGGNDGNACTSAAAPCGTIQGAVNKASSGDTIQIAAGTYGFTVDQCGSGINAVVCVAEKSITLRGANSANTFIDGGGARRGVAVLGNAVQPLVTVESLTIRNGVATPFGGYAATGQSHGGGMLVNNASVTLRNVQFTNNRSVGSNLAAAAGGIGAGGGLSILWIPGQLPSQINTLQNVSFSDNRAEGGTGSVRGGEAQGGAMFTYYAKVNASGLSVVDNVAQAGSSGGSGGPGGQLADGLGGGLSFQAASDVTIQSATLTGNQARGGGAATAAGNAFGGAIFSEQATLNLSNLNIQDNSAIAGNASNGTGGVGGGGAIAHDTTNMTLSRSELLNNSSQGGNGNTAGAAGGGAIYVTRFNPPAVTSNIVNTIIANNVTRQGSGNPAGGGGGGIWLQGPAMNLTHVTLARNSTAAGMLGQAMIAINDGAQGPSVAGISYSIIADHAGAAIIAAAGTTFNLNRGLWAGNSSNIDQFNGPATISGGGSMLSAASAGFGANFRLASGSPAIDQATGSSTTVDIDGQSRPQGAANDIGADEFYPPLVNGRPWAYLPMTFR